MSQELNTESLLLMHLAGELPAGEAAALERRLAQDPALRAERDLLAATMQSFESGMRQADSAPLPGAAQAVRRIGLAMRSEAARKLAERQPRVDAAAARHYPWWLYPSASAAAVLIGLLCWWGYRPDSLSRLPAGRDSYVKNGPLMLPRINPAPPSGEPTREHDEASPSAVELTRSFSDMEPEQREASLSKAESQIAELINSHSATIRSDFSFSDGNE